MFFSDSSQMMLKLGRNIRWVETLLKIKNFDGIISNWKVCHNRHFDASITEKVQSLHCFFVFGWIKLKFGVRGNFGFLISNLNSKTQYQFEILRKMPLFFSSIMILAQHSLMNWLPWQQ